MGWFSCRVRDVWTEENKSIAQRSARETERSLCLVRVKTKTLSVSLRRCTSTPRRSCKNGHFMDAWMWSRGCSHSEKRRSTRLPTRSARSDEP